MRLHAGRAGASEAAELAVTSALLRQAAAGEVPETLRIYRPAGPAVVFGRRDTHRPGFRAAVESAAAAGFETSVRGVGGRAVAYTGNALVVDHVCRQVPAAAGLNDRFARFGDRYATALRELGVDARVGPVPGEYCAGEHSVNARSVVKLVGTAQRVVRNGWLFSALIVIDDAEPLRRVLTDVYAALDLPFDPRTVGSVADEVPGCGVAEVERRIRVAHGVDSRPATPFESSTLAAAEDLVPRHLV
ncbi:lipoate--protein ligase family protein [Amycolatopsis viridis]|uniref:Lipoate-protein ligase A n=1 Tax=Amycolatopsis viridis TaxID=185678 RepID=A0ABX0SZ54_9PSEU|nr:lipoate--protein ligase family protein [Amycolatopsis viridis]NIH82242.1 lipoate-protein ligase A [Amycolatopsis viridis]